MAYPKPRRRHCRRAISLAASTQARQKRFLREKSRFRGLPRNAGHPFGRQGISSSVNAAGIPVGCLGSGKRMLPAYRQTYLCARMRRNNFPHENTRVPRRSAFWPKPQKAPKALFNPPAPKRATLLREGMFRASRETPTESAVRRLRRFLFRLSKKSFRKK